MALCQFRGPSRTGVRDRRPHHAVLPGDRARDADRAVPEQVPDRLWFDTLVESSVAQECTTRSYFRRPLLGPSVGVVQRCERLPTSGGSSGFLGGGACRADLIVVVGVAG
jgi:hypothetical protein